MKETRKKNTKRNITRGKIIFIISIIFIVFVFARSIIEVQLLKHYGVCKKGIITDVRLTSPHSKPDLMYKFEYKGEIYKGHSSTDDENQIWDSICIVFLESYPSIQRPLSFFDYGETKCKYK